jgi:hypothetical protein
VADSQAFRGQQAEILIAIEDSAGFRDSVCFEISIGEITTRDPVGRTNTATMPLTIETLPTSIALPSTTSISATASART